MPWFAWIAIVAIIVFGGVQVISMLTGRPIPSGSHDAEEIDQLKRRIKALRRRVEALEGKAPADELEPGVPTRREENLAAEDRWRLDSLEARLDRLEGPHRPGGGERPPAEPT